MERSAQEAFDAALREGRARLDAATSLTEELKRSASGFAQAQTRLAQARTALARRLPAAPPEVGAEHRRAFDAGVNRIRRRLRRGIAALSLKLFWRRWSRALLGLILGIAAVWLIWRAALWGIDAFESGRLVWPEALRPSFPSAEQPAPDAGGAP